MIGFLYSTINITDEISKNMQHLRHNLEQSPEIISVYIDSEDASKEGKTLLNTADQRHLAEVLKGSRIKNLIFRHCCQFEFEEGLEKALKDNGIKVSWEE